MPKFNKHMLIDEFEPPTEEIDLIDSIRYFVYTQDISGLFEYIKLLIKESIIILKKN